MLYDKQQWIDDIDRVIAVIPEIGELAGKSVLITGASGLICSPIVDILFRYNDTHKETIKILAAGRKQTSMRNRFGYMMERKDFLFIPYDATKADNYFPEHADYIIHGASNAFPSKVIKEPVETMLSNFLGMLYLLDFAEKTNARRVLYISSSEVYGKKEGNAPFQENEYGFVDLLRPRSSYAIGKRAAETLCAAYTAEYGVETVIIRPGHVYGPTASINDTRVSSVWPYAAARGEDIVMKSDGSQLRSYCYCLDCASAIIKILLQGETLSAYNISNPDSVISIKELALLIAKASGINLRMEVPSEKERAAFNPMNNSSLDASALLGIGWRGLFTAEEGLTHTVSLIKDLV